MSTTMLENIELRVSSPAVKLAGLEKARQQLEALTASLKQAQSQIAGLSTNTAFRLTAKQYEELARSVKGSEGVGKGKIGAEALSKRAGFHKAAREQLKADGQAMVATVEDVLKAIDKRLSGMSPTSKSGTRANKAWEKLTALRKEWESFVPFANAGGSVFKSGHQAGLFLGGGMQIPKLPRGVNIPAPMRQLWEKGWAPSALAQQQKGMAALGDIVTGRVGGAAAPAAPATGPLPNNLQEAVNAALGAAKTAAEVAAAAAAGVDKAGKTKQKKDKEAGSEAPAAPAGPAPEFTAGGGLLETQRTVYVGSDTPDKLRQTRRAGEGRTVIETIQGETVTQTTKEAVGKRLAKGFDQTLNALANEYARVLPTTAPEVARRNALRQAGELYKSNPQFAALGLRERMAEFVGQLGERRTRFDQWQLGREERADRARRDRGAYRAEVAPADPAWRSRLMGEAHEFARAKMLPRVLQQLYLGQPTGLDLPVNLSGFKGWNKRQIASQLQGMSGFEGALRELPGYRRAYTQYAVQNRRPAWRAPAGVNIEQQAALAMQDAATNQQAERERAQRDRVAARERARIDAARAKADAAMRTRQTLRTQEELKRRMVEQAERDLVSRGARTVKQDVDPLTGRRTGATYQLDRGGQRETYRVDYTRNAGQIRLVRKEVRETRKEVELLSGDFLKNTLKVTAWASSVMVLYKGLGLVTHGFERMVEIGFQSARLEQVFRGVGGTTQELTRDVLHLAAVYGRSTEEAMQSAVQWARLGLTRRQINEAVRTSLMAANVAEMTAAEATEHLQSVMQNYGLRVGELQTVLGELNQISNTYNVTTNALMQGLSRTAAVAKQAGLPLAELSGLLGATIGKTGQSGANIGNAIKSVILALSNPALQEKLRTVFRFEVTQGGEDLKGMSDLLGDLYIRFVKLNEIQRQSLLFSVAGRTQANRLAALLENYIEAQKRAIDAQLNLNSAESENAKITATLKAQLAGVTAEWERFVVIQGNMGMGEKNLGSMTDMLGTMAVSLRNVLQLMNAPGMRLLTTVALGAGVAGLARSTLAMVGAGGGFVGRTGQAIMREANALGAASTAALQRGLSQPPSAQRYTQYRELRQQGMTSGQAYAAMGPGSGAGRVNRALAGADAFGNRRWAEAIKQLETARYRMAALNATAAVSAKTFAAAGLAVKEFALPLLAIYGVMKGFNAIMEAYGQTIEATQEKLAGLNREGEAARSAADAYGEAAQTLSKLGQAITPDRLGAMSGERLQGVLQQVAELMHLDERDATVRAQKEAASRQEIERLRQANNLMGIRNLLEERAAGYQAARARKANEEFVANRRALEEVRAKIGKLERQDQSNAWGREGRQKNLKELRAQEAELQGKGVRIVADENDTLLQSLDNRLRYDVKHLAMLEQERQALQGIAELYQTFDTSNPMERAALEVAVLRTQVGVIQQQKQALAQADTQDMAARAGWQQEKTQKQAALTSANENLAATTSAFEEHATKFFPKGYLQRRRVEGLSPDDLARFGPEGQRRYDAMREAQQKQMEAQRTWDQLRPETSTNPAMIGWQGRDAARTALNQEQNQKAAELAAREANQAQARKALYVGFGQRRAEERMAGTAYGIDETDKLARQRESLTGREKFIREVDKQLGTDEAIKEVGPAEVERGHLEAIGELTRNLQQQEQNLLALRMRRASVEAEIHQLAINQNREFARQFFGSGPAEMLRKLAAVRTAVRGPVSQGQMFGMGAAMRQDVAMLTGKTPEMVQLQNERTRADRTLGEAKAEGGQADVRFLEIADKVVEVFNDPKLAEAIGSGLAGAMNDAVTRASQTMDRLNTAASAAADALGRIAGVLAANGPGMAGLRTAAPGQIGGGWSAGSTVDLGNMGAPIGT